MSFSKDDLSKYISPENKRENFSKKSLSHTNTCEKAKPSLSLPLKLLCAWNHALSWRRTRLQHITEEEPHFLLIISFSLMILVNLCTLLFILECERTPFPFPQSLLFIDEEQGWWIIVIYNIKLNNKTGRTKEGKMTS